MEAWGETDSVQTSEGENDQERSDLDVHVKTWARVNAPVRIPVVGATSQEETTKQVIQASAHILEVESPQGDERQGGQFDPRGYNGSERGETSEGWDSRTIRPEIRLGGERKTSVIRKCHEGRVETGRGKTR